MKRDEVLASALAVQPITRDVLQEKYLKPGETDVEDLFARVARGAGLGRGRGRAREVAGAASTPTCAPAPSAPAAS